MRRLFTQKLLNTSFSISFFSVINNGWFAGGYLNYYYYGFVIAGIPVNFLGITPAFAYNLILATMFCLTVAGAFSAGWNLGKGYRFWPGLAAALGMAVFGNLGTLRMILRGYQGLVDGRFLSDGPSFFERIPATFQGIARFLSGQTLPYSMGDWYWIPSRVIPAPNDVEPITEFPYFTFLYADLHAHMIALPIALLPLVWALSLILGRAWTNRDGVEGSRPFQIVSSFLLGGLAIGALRAINTWDLYTYLALGCLAMGFSLWVYLPVGATTFKDSAT